VCDPRGQVWDTPGLYVFDGSAFPTASGVNPMVTIEALAHMNARGLAAKLG
jgi:choline dehydrogenase-like flavoprotein